MEKVDSVINFIENKLDSLASNDSKLDRMLKNKEIEIEFEKELKKMIRDFYYLKLTTCEISEEEMKEYKKLDDISKEKEFKKDLKMFNNYKIKELDYKINLLEKYIKKLKEDKNYQIFINNKKEKMNRNEYKQFAMDSKCFNKTINKWFEEYRNKESN